MRISWAMLFLLGCATIYACTSSAETTDTGAGKDGGTSGFDGGARRDAGGAEDGGICLPECSGKECGQSDGCGAKCDGPCPEEGEVCKSGKCVACTPNCQGFSCGQKDPECGIACTACEEGSCCDGDCMELAADKDNCGKCGKKCDTGETCVAGECKACTADCSDKDCGDDGCGGSCGKCGTGKACFNNKCGDCTPACGSKVCGDDGCGGSCGNCPSNQTCADGQCATCTANCAGKYCGEDDGCGGKCASGCPNGGTCQDGACVGGCEPDCSGKSCGSDGCGGTCGTCGWPFTCNPSGDCECKPKCTTEGRECGPDGCGGTCGTCTGEKNWCNPTLHLCAVDPKDEGCADGERDGFTDRSLYPDIASCAGTFQAQSLRTTRTGKSCGNKLGPCTVPEDLCAEGWHICMKNGWPGDLKDRVTPEDCKSPLAGAGIFVAASDSAVDVTEDDHCIYEPLPLPCTFWIKVTLPYNWGYVEKGTVACGPDTWLGGTDPIGYNIEACTDIVWQDSTPIITVDGDCNNMVAATGVLCCKDPPVVGH